ncbi:DNA-binding protein WhiA [Mesomycoplasma ovipneumoniae]|uniref:DNA-binding protein WhiA n=1 Tax=Mesomycoplasma ovipneumoniae TaxID=29562 RepID=A0AAJ2PA99_9BACT|nr:DNA-binding protein WhiA [Mesomycoplasma ovipneumoniae]MDW2906087.1 DNA-binding protein WhiA [Mesomycoplasma ovipneumoniae]MDW2913952.1 DNA-binding protein WhiA [Mesomycoplasma ovipneumoniae]
MTFSQQAKLEILANRLTRPKFNSLVKGLIFSSSLDDDPSLFILRINKNEINSRLIEIFRKFQLNFSETRKNKNWICIEKKLIKIDKTPENIQYFFAGLFIGGGSISPLGSKSYHLEISFLDKSKCEKVLNILRQNQLEFTFKQIFYQNRLKIYLKKVNEIIYFLMAIGALEQASKLEILRIERDHYLNANRITNFDIKNAKKISESSTNFIKKWKLIQKNNLTSKFSDQELIFFEIRQKNPELSLQEICKILKKEYNIIRTKAGLNYWLVKSNKILEKGVKNAQ